MEDFHFVEILEKNIWNFKYKSALEMKINSLQMHFQSGIFGLASDWSVLECTTSASIVDTNGLKNPFLKALSLGSLTRKTGLKNQFGSIINVVAVLKLTTLALLCQCARFAASILKLAQWKFDWRKTAQKLLKTGQRLGKDWPKNGRRLLEECSKSVQRVFQECSMSVRRVFKECSKSV